MVQAAATSAPRVLLVEDDTSTRDALFVAFTMAGFQVRALATGETFEDALDEYHPDIVVLDVWLPAGPDGFKLAELVRAKTNVPVMFVTAADGIDNRLRGFEVGADDYVVKPFAVAEVIARMQAVLRRAGRVAAPSVHVGDLSVDRVNQVAYRAGERLELTATEFELLATLAKTPFQVFSKRELLSVVWGLDASRENLVEVYVSTLRRKLEEHGHRMIITERSRGYVLRP